MYNVLLANAAGNLYPNKTHRITMKELCQLIGYQSNDYKRIKMHFRELRRMDIEWDIINEAGNKVWTNASPLSLARVIEGQGICEYEFTPGLVPFLDRPARYAKFALSIQAKFKSNYGLALYENCERYKKIGYTRNFDIATFRRLMGVDSGKYFEFFALKRRVITKAVSEVNQHADFDIEPEYHKKNRNVVSIKFIIRAKKALLENSVDPQENEVSIDTELETKLVGYFGLSKQEIEKYLKQYDNNYLNEKVNTILDSDGFKKGQIRNMAGYLKSSIVENYLPVISSRLVVEKQENKKKIVDELRSRQHGLIQKAKYAHRDYLLTCIPEIFLKKLTQKDKRIVIAGFSSYIADTCYAEAYKNEGLNNILVCDNFLCFLEKQHSNLLQKLFPLEVYIQQNCPEIEREIFELSALINKELAKEVA